MKHQGRSCESTRSKLQKLLLGVEVAEEVAGRSKFVVGSCANQEGRLTWSWRVLVKSHMSWNSSIEDSIRREEFLGVFLSTREVLALVDHLYLVSFFSLFFMFLVVV